MIFQGDPMGAHLLLFKFPPGLYTACVFCICFALLFAGFLLDLLFDPEDGGSMTS